MNIHGQTVLITGGGSGIGKGLAEAFHRLGNRVIVAGRREEPLKSVCAANAGMQYVLMDVADPGSIRGALFGTSRPGSRSSTASSTTPDCSGCTTSPLATGSTRWRARGGEHEPAGRDPLLRGVPAAPADAANASLVNVSSGLAFVPLARFPVYCATKAAVHSFCLSLRRQLRGTGVKLVELIPPYVATELDRTTRDDRPHAGPQPMPLEAFIAEAMKELASGGEELPVADAKYLHSAGTGEMAKTVFERMNG